MADLSKEVALSSINAGVQNSSTTVNWLVLASATSAAWILNTAAAPDSAIGFSGWVLAGLVLLGLSALSGVANAFAFNRASARNASMNIQLAEKYSLLAHNTSLVEKHISDAQMLDALEPIKRSAETTKQEATAVVGAMLPDIQKLAVVQNFSLAASGSCLVLGEICLAVAVFG